MGRKVVGTLLTVIGVLGVGGALYNGLQAYLRSILGPKDAGLLGNTREYLAQADLIGSLILGAVFVVPLLAGMWLLRRSKKAATPEQTGAKED